MWCLRYDGTKCVEANFRHGIVPQAACTKFLTIGGSYHCILIRVILFDFDDVCVFFVCALSVKELRQKKFCGFFELPIPAQTSFLFFLRIPRASYIEPTGPVPLHFIQELPVLFIRWILTSVKLHLCIMFSHPRQSTKLRSGGRIYHLPFYLLFRSKLTAPRFHPNVICWVLHVSHSKWWWQSNKVTPLSWAILFSSIYAGCVFFCYHFELKLDSEHEPMKKGPFTSRQLPQPAGGARRAMVCQQGGGGRAVSRGVGPAQGGHRAWADRWLAL